MDTQDIRTLKILQEFNEQNSPSQRYLAKKLNLSLGLVNAFLKRLAQKGYFKITTIPKNRARYILTPQGAVEKARLTYEYVRYSLNYYRSAKDNLQLLFNDLESQGIQDIAFYGASDLAEIAYITLQGTSLRLKGIMTDQPQKKKFMGMKTISIKNISTIPYDKILITAMDDIKACKKRLTRYGVHPDKIVTYDPTTTSGPIG